MRKKKRLLYIFKQSKTINKIKFGKTDFSMSKQRT